MERLILSRLQEKIDDKLIKEQCGFRPGKSCTGQVLNLTEFIEEGFQKGMVTGVVFVDLSAAYDTVCHRLLISKLHKMTKDYKLTKFIEQLLANRRFYVEFSGKPKSRWRKQRNGLPQGSVLSPILFNVYTNDQPLLPNTANFIYADDRCTACQGKDFDEVERTLNNALASLSEYYKQNCLRANPSKTQVCAFHLRNREAERELSITWEGVQLVHCKYPVYLGVNS